MSTIGIQTPPTGNDAARAPAPVTTATLPHALATAIFPPDHSARLTDLLISLLIISRVPVPGLPTGSYDQLGLFLLVAIAVFRRPVRAVPVWYPVAALGLLSFLVFESAINAIPPGAFVQRSLNISLSLVTVGFMASGRIDVASVIKGIAIALGINAVLFYAGVAPHPYGEFLTGYLMDKNVSGLFFATVPLLLAAALPHWWQRIAVLMVGGGALWLTGSRTSMAAYAAALVWVAVSARSNWVVKLGVGGALYAAFLFASDNLAHVGSFAARTGSDLFRAEIDEATFAKVADTPWYGKGLSEATVTLADDSQWFFHNSFAALWVEGGLVMTIIVIGLYGGALLGLARRRAGSFVGAAWDGAAVVVSSDDHLMGWREHFPRLMTAGALGAVLLCATRLGEVFMAQIGFIVLGTAVALLLERHPYEASPWALSATKDNST